MTHTQSFQAGNFVFFVRLFLFHFVCNSLHVIVCSSNCSFTGRLLSFLFIFPYVFDCEHVFLMTVRFQQCLQITNEKEVTVEFNAIE